MSASANTDSKTRHGDRLAALRAAMEAEGVDGFLVPVTDEFQCEYPAEAFHRLKWLTGFSGSAGMGVVLQNKAAMFVDSRYTLQARQQVDTTAYDQEELSVENIARWVAKNLPKGKALGIDPRLHTWAEVEAYRKELDAVGVELKPVESNLIDQIWQDRPAIPTTPVRVYGEEYAGESSNSKRGRISQSVKDAGADAAMITDQASIAWLLNVRGNDVSHTPLALSYLLLDGSGKATWFIDENKISDEVRAHVGTDVTIQDISKMEAHFTGSEMQNAGLKVQFDLKRSPLFIRRLIEDNGNAIVEGDDPCLLPKAMKNEVEVAGIRDAHVRDGVALTKFLCWLDGEASKRDVTELEVEKKLLDFRTEQDKFQEPSFDTIAGAGEHGAIVHYRATEESDKVLAKNSMFLLDSGGQYLDGTTDVTRTTVIGDPTDEQKKRFTQVLKGHINLGRAVFSKGMSGAHLDILAREALLADGVNYGHGTGHGVGAYLGVHEGPQGIHTRAHTPLEPGMVISNEPGYYKEGEYGIRIESLVVVREREKANENAPVTYEFETLTLAPIERRLIDPALLTHEEVKWLDSYHQKVFDTLSPQMDAKERAWLKEKTRPLAPEVARAAADEVSGLHVKAVTSRNQQGNSRAV